MRVVRCVTVALAAVMLVAGPVGAQQLYVYPSHGQSPQQEAFDKGQCASWAIQQTGFNPAAPPPVMAEPPPPPRGGLFGGMFRGAAGGSAMGAVGGAIAGHAGEGAAIGAATGALFGLFRGAREREAQEQQEQYAQQQTQAITAQGHANWDRAYKACLSGRGYTVM